MAQLVMLGHALQTGMQVIAGGGIQLALADLAIHLVLQLVQHRAGLGVHFQLEIDEQLQIFSLLFFVFLFFHQLSKRLALDKLAHNGPLAFHHGYAKHARNVQTGFFHAGLIQSLVEDISLGIVFVKDFDAGISLAIKGFLITQSNDTIQIHDAASFTYAHRRSPSRRPQHSCPQSAQGQAWLLPRSDGHSRH